MNLLRSPLALAVGATVLVAGGAGMAVGASAAHPKAVKVCVTKKGVVRAASAKGKCPKHTHKVSVGVKGPRGATGATGATGAIGATGAKGDAGPAAVSLYHIMAPNTGESWDIPGTVLTAVCTDNGELRLGTFGADVLALNGVYSADGGAPTAIHMLHGQPNLFLAATTSITVDAAVTTSESQTASYTVFVSGQWDSAADHCLLTGQVIASS